MEKIEAKLQKYRNELNSELGSVSIPMAHEKKYHESQNSTLRKKVSKYQLRKMQLILEEMNCKLVNITFATPMVGNMALRESLLDKVVFPKEPAENMHHFVVAEDIVPAVLFTNHFYKKIPQTISLGKKE